MKDHVEVAERPNAPRCKREQPPVRIRTSTPPKNVVKPKFVKVCKCCKMTFETESKNKRHCSDECRVKSIPNIVAENFDRLYPLYVKYGALKPAFTECGIGITKTVYDRFFKEIEKRNAGVA